MTRLAVPTSEPTAANDFVMRDGPFGSDLNALVSAVIGQITARAVHPVDVELRLDPEAPRLRVDRAVLAFALAGVFTTVLRRVDEGRGTMVQVETRRRGSLTQLEITAGWASSPGAAHSSLAGATLAHCQRLIEAQGGAVAIEPSTRGFRLTIAFDLRQVPGQSNSGLQSSPSWPMTSRTAALRLAA